MTSGEIVIQLLLWQVIIVMICLTLVGAVVITAFYWAYTFARKIFYSYLYKKFE